jgi:hypothetical protein
MPKPFMKGIPTNPPQNPVVDSKAGSTLKVIKTVPVEVLRMALQNDNGGDDPAGSKPSSSQDSAPQTMQPTPISHN